MPASKLTPISYLVLGLVADRGPCTSYEMEREVANSIGNFWNFPHAQLYAEPNALVAAGLLWVKSEDGGRRRKHYSVTKNGMAALQAWLAEPSGQFIEIRDLALLKFFFSKHAAKADVRRLAAEQLAAHRSKLADYETQLPGAERRGRGIEPLHLGLAFEHTVIDFWERVATQVRLARQTTKR